MLHGSLHEPKPQKYNRGNYEFKCVNSKTITIKSNEIIQFVSYIPSENLKDLKWYSIDAIRIYPFNLHYFGVNTLRLVTFSIIYIYRVKSLWL